MHERDELEGWLVTHVGPAEAEEAWRLINTLIDAERDAVIEANAALREGWKLSSTKFDVETYSRMLAERLFRLWTSGKLPTAD